MTNREKEIYDILLDDPFISQEEISKKLGITRSSVSVYITNMLKSGVIRGRGYVVDRDRDNFPVVIGSANIDIIFAIDSARLPTAGLQPRPILFAEDAAVSVSYGGCGKNIVENLSKLGRNPRAIFALATDALSKGLLLECEEHGISTGSSLIVEGMNTSIAFELYDKQTEAMLIGLRNVDIIERLTPAFLEQKYMMLKNASQIVLESVLKDESIEYITAAFRNTPIFLQMSTHYNLEHITSTLGRYACVLLGFSDAMRMAGIAEDRREDSRSWLPAIAKRVLSLGARGMVVSFDGDGLCYISPETCAVYRAGRGNERSAEHKNFRDAAMAGLTLCLGEGYSVEDALKFVAAVRLVTTEGESYVAPNLCADAVRAVMKTLPDDFSYFEA